MAISVRPHPTFERKGDDLYLLPAEGDPVALKLAHEHARALREELAVRLAKLSGAIPEVKQLVSKIQGELSTSAFAAGFFVRPFGAIVFGRLGDLIGRKYTFLVTILLMGGATFIVGLLPGYATLGINLAGVQRLLSVADTVERLREVSGEDSLNRAETRRRLVREIDRLIEILGLDLLHDGE